MATRIHIGHHYVGMDAPEEDGVVSLDEKGRIQIDAPTKHKHESLARLIASMANNPQRYPTERHLFESLPHRLNNGYTYAHVEDDDGQS